MCGQHDECSHWTFVFNYLSELFKCTLLSSCEERRSYSYPDKTISGGKDCQPVSEKRRKCRPGCSNYAPYCHGRCVYGGRGCFFAPCSRSPYREDSGDTCSQYVMDAVENDCKQHCTNVETDTEEMFCKICLEGNLGGRNASQCLEMSGAPCWTSTSQVAEKLGLCAQYCSTPLDTVQCVAQEVAPRSRSCVCTLLCYWSPTGDLCRSCLDQPQLAERFLHHEHCPQGWVYSQASSMCFKSFNEVKPWKYAVRYCDYGGGRLGQAKNSSSLQIVLEAINLRAPAGEYWLGGKENVVGAGISGWPNEYVWTGDRTLVDDDNWPTGYPALGFSTIDDGSALPAQSSFIWTPNYPNKYDNNYGQVRALVN